LKYAFQQLKEKYEKYNEFKLINTITKNTMKMNHLVKEIELFCKMHSNQYSKKDLTDIANTLIIAKIFQNIIVKKTKYSQEYNQTNVEDYLTLRNEIMEKIKNIPYIPKAQEVLLQKIEKLESIAKTLTENNCQIDWHSIWRLKGLWNLYAGKHKAALEEYKKFALKIFYTGDENANKIYVESLILMATFNNMPFFKNLKHIGILFEELGKSNPNIGTISKNEILNKGDLMGFAKRFSEKFPRKCFFDKKDYPEDKCDNPTLCLDIPEKKIKRFGLIYPQIVWFSSEDDTDSVKKLLEKNANVNRLSEPENESALLWTICQNNQEIFNLLIEKTEAKIINTQARDEYTCLGHAIDKWNLELVEILLKHGADIKQPFTPAQQSPLYFAINKIVRSIKPPQLYDIINFSDNLSADSCETVRKLSNSTFSGMINSEIRELCSTISLFGSDFFKELIKEDSIKAQTRIPMIKLLLKYKADPNAKEKYSDDTPRKLAERNQLDDIIKILTYYTSNS